MRHLGDAAGAGFAAEALVGLEGSGGLFRLRGRYEGSAPRDGLVDGRGGLGAHGVGDVGVDVQRRGHAVVADDGGEGFHVHAGLQRQRGESVAEVVKTELAATGVIQDRLYPLADGSRVKGRVGLYRGGEHPLGRGAASHFDEDVEQSLGDQKAPRRRLCLWRGDGQLAACAVDLPLHSQLSRFGIQVRPLQRQYLTSPEAGGQLQQDQLVVALLFCLGQEALELLAGQHLLFAAGTLGELALLGGIPGDQPLLHGLGQCRADAEVTALHQPVRHTGSVDVPVRQTSVLLEVGVEFLQDFHGDYIQRHLPYPWDDVVVDLIFVVLAGLESEAGFLIVVKCVSVLSYIRDVFTDSFR